MSTAHRLEPALLRSLPHTLKCGRCVRAGRFPVPHLSLQRRHRRRHSEPGHVDRAVESSHDGVKHFVGNARAALRAQARYAPPSHRKRRSWRPILALVKPLPAMCLLPENAHCCWHGAQSPHLPSASQSSSQRTGSCTMRQLGIGPRAFPKDDRCYSGPRLRHATWSKPLSRPGQRN